MDSDPERRRNPIEGKRIRGFLPSLVQELGSSSTRLNDLLLLARELDEASAISGRRYAEFRIALERAFRLKLANVADKTRVEEALDRLVVAKGRRITGLDAEELEASLRRAGTVEVDGKAVPVLSDLQVAQIATQYEALRKEIRNTRWNHPAS